MRILLVEDDEPIRSALAEFLESEGYECAQAEDGLEAMEILEAEASSIDLLISDFRMPRMDGVDLLKWCREQDFAFPVLFITAQSDLLAAERIALVDSHARLLRKPIELDDLAGAVEQACAQRSQPRDIAV